MTKPKNQKYADRKKAITKRKSSKRYLGRQNKKFGRSFVPTAIISLIIRRQFLYLD